MPRVHLLAIFMLWCGATGVAQNTHPATAISRTEVVTAIKVLEQAHYNRAAVGPPNYASLIRDYMEGLDPQRLYFVATDLAFLDKSNAATLYQNLAVRGSLDTAHDVFELYRTRVRKRTEWVLRALEKRFEFSTDESLLRHRKSWPQSATEADDAWRKQLKSDLLDELLNGASAESAAHLVRNRNGQIPAKVDAFGSGGGADELFLSMVCQLYDAHSDYYSAGRFEGFMRGDSMATVGTTFQRVDADLLVTQIAQSSSSDGYLRLNDRLVALAEENRPLIFVHGFREKDIESLLPGAPGTKLQVVVRPREATDSSVRRSHLLTRTITSLESVRAASQMVTLPEFGSSVGVLTLRSLYGVLPQDDNTAGKDVARLLREMRHGHAAGIVLDLRGNRGGYLTEAIEIAGHFLGRQLVIRIRNYNGESLEHAGRQQAIFDGPLVVLVDQNTASGAEIMAGALQTYGRAVIVGGERTQGIGTIQQVLEVKQLSKMLSQSKATTGSVKLTIQKFYLPDGASVQLQGVRPDINIPLLEDVWADDERSKRRVLVYDRIDSKGFKATPLKPALLSGLREASRQRQETMPEFSVVRKQINWWRTRAIDEVSLNLEKRRRQRAEDENFWRDSTAQLAQLIGSPPASSVAPAADIPLREAVRILADLIRAEP